MDIRGYQQEWPTTVVCDANLRNRQQNGDSPEQGLRLAIRRKQAPSSLE
jgi:hypothetical protein